MFLDFAGWPHLARSSTTSPSVHVFSGSIRKEITYQVIPHRYNQNMTVVRRTYQKRAHLTRGKHRRLDEAFHECARLHNAALNILARGLAATGVGIPPRSAAD